MSTTMTVTDTRFPGLRVTWRPGWATVAWSINREEWGEEDFEEVDPGPLGAANGSSDWQREAPTIEEAGSVLLWIEEQFDRIAAAHRDEER